MSSSSVDWPAIRTRASSFPEEAFDFVREGLKHTVQTRQAAASARHAGKPISKDFPLLDDDDLEEPRHISGQQLCLGLRDLAIQRYGLLAQTVLSRWGIRRTEDFGTIVFSLIDRGELRASDNDSIQDFKAVYDFSESFGAVVLS